MNEYMEINAEERTFVFVEFEVYVPQSLESFKLLCFDFLFLLWGYRVHHPLQECDFQWGDIQCTVRIGIAHPHCIVQSCLALPISNHGIDVEQRN
jgi:hypothetical protein